MTENIDYLRTIHNRRLQSISMNFIRSIYGEIDWRDRLITIGGARGVGKTTLVLQYLKKQFGFSEEALYVSLDNLWFSEHSLRDVAEYHNLHGGTCLVIDEVHYYKHWQQLIKNLYDDFPDLHIIYTGSSLLKLETGDADLSRRQISYDMHGLSFREYLAFEKILTTEALSLQDLLQMHCEIAGEIVANIAIKILSAFDRYLQYGYYPFYKEVFGGYYARIAQIINQVLESDYPCVRDVTFLTIQKTKKMLMILAENAPQTPNMSLLYKELETDRNQGLKMLYVLERAGILHLLSSEAHSLKNMSRPDKIYCENTNIMNALMPSPDIGCIRETFFLNQLRNAGYMVHYPAAGDFLVDSQYLFEVGGKNKTFAQIRDIPDSYLAVDGIEIGSGNKIPLWMFGMLY